MKKTYLKLAICVMIALMTACEKADVKQNTANEVGTQYIASEDTNIISSMIPPYATVHKTVSSDEIADGIVVVITKTEYDDGVLTDIYGLYINLKEGDTWRSVCEKMYAFLIRKGSGMMSARIASGNRLFIDVDMQDQGSMSYNFRLQDGDFRLIGFDYNALEEGRDRQKTSINYLTRRRQVRLYDFSTGRLVHEMWDDFTLGELFSISTIDFIEKLPQLGDDMFAVSTVEDFARYIGSDRTIFIVQDIDFSGMPPHTANSHYRRFQTYNGWEFQIHDVKNLKIVGIGDTQIRLVTPVTYAAVLYIRNALNFSLKNIYAGHYPEKGDCSGAVFNIFDSSLITIENVTMYGCGTYGIDARGTSHIAIKNSTVKGCNHGIVFFYDVHHVSFTDCTFTDNEGMDMIAIHNSSAINFERVKFDSNTAKQYDWAQFSIFNIQNSRTIQIINSTFTNNTTDYFANNSDSIRLLGENIIGQDNVFRLGMYP